MKSKFFICVLTYPSFSITSRVIIRDDREEMKAKLREVIKMRSDIFHIDAIAQYDFDNKATKYYTPEKFLDS